VADRIPQVANVVISNVPGPPVPLYMAGARMLTNYPTSIVVHGMALNITVQSYAGSLEFGLTACRRVLPQDESHELIEHLRAALQEIRDLPALAEVAAAAPQKSLTAASVAPAPAAPSAKRAKVSPSRTGKAAGKPAGGKPRRDAVAAGKRAH
jgi:hypothetical protein